MVTIRYFPYLFLYFSSYCGGAYCSLVQLHSSFKQHGPGLRRISFRKMVGFVKKIATNIETGMFGRTCYIREATLLFLCPWNCCAVPGRSDRLKQIPVNLAEFRLVLSFKVGPFALAVRIIGRIVFNI